MTGWVSHTLGRTERQVEGLNRGEWYVSRFDRTHTLNVVAQYELNKKWSFGANFSYVSGVPYTLPEQKIIYAGSYLPLTPQGTRGNIRVPAYHRLDFSATRKNKKALFGKGESEWVFGLYNVYNRRNPFSIYAQTNPDNPTKTEAIQLSIIGSVIPSVTYNFKF